MKFLTIDISISRALSILEGSSLLMGVGFLLEFGRVMETGVSKVVAYVEPFGVQMY